MSYIVRSNVAAPYRLRRGTLANLAFTFDANTGVYIDDANTVQCVSMGNVVAIGQYGVTATAFVGDGSGLTTTPPMTIANISVTNAQYTVVDDTAVSTNGGYIIVNGSGFAQGTVVLVDQVVVTSTTYVSSAQLRCQLASKSAGTYSLSVVRLDSVTASLPVGVTFSPFPAWSTGSTLANVIKTVAFTQNLAATEATGENITYTVADGSSLPANVILTSNGVLSGNILTDQSNSTTYTFIVQATDAQFQNIPRTFSLFAAAA